MTNKCKTYFYTATDTVIVKLQRLRLKLVVTFFLLIL